VGLHPDLRREQAYRNLRQMFALVGDAAPNTATQAESNDNESNSLLFLAGDYLTYWQPLRSLG
jgi:hypothetical protein